MTAGYSKRSLAQKLGLKPGMRCWWYNMPQTVSDEIAAGVDDLVLLPALETGISAAHIFVTGQSELSELLSKLRRTLDAHGMIWVSWPKKASKVSSEVTEDTVREVCLPMGLVDIKVCAVDAVWSGIKLVIRKELREEHRQMQLAANEIAES
ncbi:MULTISPECIES: DUF3052 family protein [unclassified Pseudovibrio]|uniref:DUF3052 family protein n=1 Tax=unclassified Pseudovibrio TaxID=2627060 RepID=UPI0007AE7141|nr:MULTISPECIES: DUF3052 family protein [unclassified Pseudovibrio]KZL02876.1 hypothetical protein PsW74_01074 [Pseudovibrio sp. W74]KZL07579.1 hypothetical protein PsAD14_03969 [Pseudovibrio sp. Ad14]